MAGVKISAMTPAASVTGSEKIPVVQGAANVVITPDQIATRVTSPIASYTETGATLTFVAAASGDIAIPGDGKVYQLTITESCDLTTPAALWPTAPECATVTVAILIDTATPPTITTPATWNWADSIRQPFTTTNGARCVLDLTSYPQGWIEASVRPIGVPA